MQQPRGERISRKQITIAALSNWLWLHRLHRSLHVDKRLLTDAQQPFLTAIKVGD
jgi:hypothetical protein